MELSSEKESVKASVADFRRSLIRKITDRTVAELGEEMGISPEDLPKWSLMVKRAEKTAASFEKTLVPARRVQELEGEIEELKKVVEKQAVVLKILKKNGIV